MWIVCDIETDSLTPTVIHCIVAKEVDSGKIHTFHGKNHLRVFKNFCQKISGLIGHNILGFDFPVLLKFIPDLPLTVDDCIDTLVISRLLNYKLPGGHSLESWGERLGYSKLPFSDFSTFTNEMLDYCIRDVEVTHKLYERFLPYITSDQWKPSIRLEHDTAIICNDLHTNGFVFDKPKALKLLEEAKSLLSSLDKELQESFPPKTSLVRVITPKATKSGTLSMTDFRWLKDPENPKAPIDLKVYTLGAPFSRIEWVTFNPGSHKQVVDRLWEVGWEPYEKTDTHRDQGDDATEEMKRYGWKVNEANLETIPEDAPESIRKLVQRFLIANRTSTLEQWCSLTSEAPCGFKGLSEDEVGRWRIHGRFNHIGAWSHRMSHADPNMANAPSVDSKYQSDDLKEMARYWGTHMRSLFTVPKGCHLVGVDAEGIQLRGLAHYMNDPVFTEALVNGDKDLGTDAHSLNANVLEVSRPRAKTFIYAWLLGASVNSGKIPHILDCSKSMAKKKVSHFLEAYPGLKKLRDYDIPRDAANGYFVGLDGRLVMCNSEHLMLAGYLQNFEAVVMKYATRLWYNQLIRKEKLPIKFVDFVHDELQCEVNGDEELARYVAKVQMESFEQAGKELGVRCPLSGSYNIGKTWADTH